MQQKRIEKRKRETKKNDRERGEKNYAFFYADITADENNIGEPKIREISSIIAIAILDISLLLPLKLLLLNFLA